MNASAPSSAGFFGALQDQRWVWWLVGVLVALAVIGIVWRVMHKKVATSSDEEDRIDTLTGWPPQATRLLTNAERVAFGTLSRALPEYMVLSQVPLSRFINVPKRNSYAEWLRRLGNQCVDFLVCDMNSQIIAVVDVQLPPAQTTDRAKKRQTRIARTLKAASVPLHVWFETSLPPTELAREMLLAKPEPVAGAPAAGSTTAPAAAKPQVVAPTAAVGPAVAGTRPPFNPFEDTGRDSTHDEFIEMEEPPPSTWYDEFDSGPTPLAPGKRPKR